jgi:hypothetical protein
MGHVAPEENILHIRTSRLTENDSLEYIYSLSAFIILFQLIDSLLLSELNATSL